MRTALSIRRLGLFAALSIAGGCGGSLTGPSSAAGTFSAVVNGTTWTGRGAKGTYSGGFVSISSQTASFDFATLKIIPANAPTALTAPSTFVFSPDGPGILGINAGTNGWATAETGTTGSVTITILTSSRIAGTFTADIPRSVTGGAALHLTDGKFDVNY